jgi:hypothetical protein
VVRRSIKTVSAVSVSAPQEPEERIVRGSGLRFRGSHPDGPPDDLDIKDFRQRAFCEWDVFARRGFRRKTRSAPGRSLAGGRIGEEWLCGATFLNARSLAGSRRRQVASFRRCFAKVSQDPSRLTPLPLAEPIPHCNNILCLTLYFVISVIFLSHLGTFGPDRGSCSRNSADSTRS